MYLPDDHLLPYGELFGDERAPSFDDGYANVTIKSTLCPLFGTLEDTIYVRLILITKPSCSFPTSLLLRTTIPVPTCIFIFGIADSLRIHQSTGVGRWLRLGGGGGGGGATTIPHTNTINKSIFTSLRTCFPTFRLKPKNWGGYPPHPLIPPVCIQAPEINRSVMQRGRVWEGLKR